MPEAATVSDLKCTEFLQRRLPQVKFRCAGFRKVHKQVLKRFLHQAVARDILDR